MLRILVWYLKLCFNPSGNKQRMAGKHLLKKRTYRLTDNTNRDVLIVLKSAYRIFKQGNKKYRNYTGIVIDNSAAQTAIFDGSCKMMEQRIAHMRENNEKPGVFISRDTLQCSFRINPESLITIFVGVFILFPVSIFAKQRRNIALILNEVTEAAYLLKICRKYNITKIHFYCPYEKDANALALLLMNKYIYINKLPSPNLLVTHNSEIISNSISLGAPYQEEELKYFSNTMLIDQMHKWTPELFHTYSETCISPNDNDRCIGFYSHGSWLRVKEGHTADPNGFYACEKAALTALSEALKDLFKDWKLIIYLHPREKKPENLEATQQYYTCIFGKSSFEFSDFNLKTAQQFSNSSIGFGGMSTILFERLFAGYKTIMYTAHFKNFPLPESPIKSISPCTEQELHKCFKLAVLHSTKDFILQTNTTKYTKESWLKN
jgi:hypothetical protein